MSKLDFVLAGGSTPAIVLILWSGPCEVGHVSGLTMVGHWGEGGLSMGLY